ncbi:lysophospholipid acyltransferase family protein [Mesohalobacter halotolerans]|uniref:1-acyl-sn-glycerol-3-phosphate acyltransferase n=1 Tax=Mesohalobacter halotolerans TaxID=1883405 RepID=A0A4U5TPS6_9FLAO|nr:lysophospholipid acyltransferase family protein [Mesohalobacter halotolerans]MBS3737608.1 1-acyl-sn-glycerol-3-phosphate acyltransferase [Psychroflexus sp.]TKS55438.1 1-acyl-sn-glycerol-3-phosphate acyltransferase [Mesohalobacter halotolerans]
MKIILNIFRLFWRIWFYVLMFFSIILLFPFLLISTLRESWYGFFFKVAKVWATINLYGMGFIPKVQFLEKMKKGKSYLLVSNHTSMIDIMLMYYISKNPFVFVGKKELAKYPLFGFFYKRTCILVDRQNSKSRHAVFYQAQERLNKGLSVCIFPEGGVPDDISIVLDTFKDGAFRLAINHQIPIVPMIFYDNKKRFSYDFFSGKPGILRAKVLNFIETKGLSLQDKRSLNKNVRQTILRELQNKKPRQN